MSKMDALRAMREAKYAQNQARGTDAPVASRPRPVAPRVPVAPPGDPDPDVGAADELCGHRNMGGRTCTREKAHSAKSHRYS